MKPKTQQAFESFSNGVCSIFDGERLKYHLRYADRVVGIKRFFEAAAAQIEVTAVIRVTQRLDITTHDIVSIGKARYRIVQVQHKNDTSPPVSDISLRQISMSLGGDICL